MGGGYLSIYYTIDPPKISACMVYKDLKPEQPVKTVVSLYLREWQVGMTSQSPHLMGTGLVVAHIF